MIVHEIGQVLLVLQRTALAVDRVVLSPFLRVPVSSAALDTEVVVEPESSRPLGRKLTPLADASADIPSLLQHRRDHDLGPSLHTSRGVLIRGARAEGIASRHNERA